MLLYKKYCGGTLMVSYINNVVLNDCHVHISWCLHSISRYFGIEVYKSS